MDWKSLSPFFVPLLIAVLVLRRATRAQKPKTVRTTRLWLFPILLLLVTSISLAREQQPGIIVSVAFLVACLAGAALGWFRVHTLEFSFDVDSGNVSARATRLGALFIVGLIGLRYLADLALKGLGLNAGSNLVRATDAMLVFSTSMLVARSIHTWIRAKTLISAHKTQALADRGGNVPP